MLDRDFLARALHAGACACLPGPVAPVTFGDALDDAVEAQALGRRANRRNTRRRRAASGDGVWAPPARHRGGRA
jgi:hypothetical protein